MTRASLAVLALLCSAQAAFAQAAPATKAPATREQPSFFTRMKRMVGLEKEPAPVPAAKPAARTDTAKAQPQGGQVQGGKAAPTRTPATKTPATKTPATKTPATKTPATKTPATATPATKAPTMTPSSMTPATKAVDTKAGAGPRGAAAGTKQGGLTVAPETAPEVKVPVIMREVFEYASEGRRDPFFSLLATSELRPALVDLRLTGVILDPSGRRSVAIMRDLKDNTQYRVTTGMQLGRMRVALIKPHVVIFSIEEFGLNRQDSLVLGDTTKVRAK